MAHVALLHTEMNTGFRLFPRTDIKSPAGRAHHGQYSRTCITNELPTECLIMGDLHHAQPDRSQEVPHGLIPTCKLFYHGNILCTEVKPILLLFIITSRIERLQSKKYICSLICPMVTGTCISAPHNLGLVQSQDCAVHNPEIRPW